MQKLLFVTLIGSVLLASAASAQQNDTVKLGEAIQKGVDERVDSRIDQRIDQKLKPLQEDLAAVKANAPATSSGEKLPGGNATREVVITRENQKRADLPKAEQPEVEQPQVESPRSVIVSKLPREAQLNRTADIGVRYQLRAAEVDEKCEAAGLSIGQKLVIQVGQGRYAVHICPDIRKPR